VRIAQFISENSPVYQSVEHES